MEPDLSGPWSASEISEYLSRNAFPLRLSCVGEDGFPRVVSVWFRYDDGVFQCVSHRSSQLVRLLERDDRVGFEVGPNEPPYCGVRGQGRVTLSPDTDGAVLTRMLERYLGGTESGLAQWLLSRADGEMLITIDPVRLFSWDYRSRMD
ncbi:MAG: pyridoxamine 5'-phosphate oxidase family protein [Halioglobus sp.]|nr:pyridoxamine 5'-phosphate oxidase family protein [Halioglobus sp.]